MTHLIITDNVLPDVPPELLLGKKQDDGVDHELRVDEHITDHDEEGREKPAVEPHHQHCGDVETKGQELDGSEPRCGPTYIMWNIVSKKFEQRDFSRVL